MHHFGLQTISLIFLDSLAYGSLNASQERWDGASAIDCPGASARQRTSCSSRLLCATTLGET